MTSPVRIEADYLIESPVDPRMRRGNHGGRAVERNVRRRARRNAGTQATRRRPGGEIELLDAVSAPSLPVARPINPDGPWQRARVTLSWPLDNIGASLPEPHHRHRRQPLGIASAHRPAAARPAAAARIRRRLCRTEVRRRWNAGTHGRARSSADRHHHQAECRPQPDRNGKSRGHAVRRRDRFHQGR